MDDFEPYSRRVANEAKSGQVQTFQFDAIPNDLRVQSYIALKDAATAVAKLRNFPSPFPGFIRRVNSDWSHLVWEVLDDTIRRHRGLLYLDKQGRREAGVWSYLANVKEVDYFLDAVEFGFRITQTIAAHGGEVPAIEGVAKAIEAFNRRFYEHDIGYQFEGNLGHIVRMDSQYTHRQAVVPAIAAVNRQGFEGALQEFTTAHEAYRNGDGKSAMNEALKAFESTMKAICDAKGWTRDSKATASVLIKLMIDKALFPKSLDSYLTNLKLVLESAVPTLRNQQSGHGQGPTVTAVPDHLVAYTLNLTASNIVFLMAAFDALP
jgi:hypothetical protein